MEGSIAPYNFSWISPNKLAGMSCPQSAANFQYLQQAGVKHLITLSAERQPPSALIHNNYPQIEWTQIAVEEFEPPTIQDIVRFINICAKHLSKNEAVGVHCRQGLGRTGVMGACYLVHFEGMAPETAICNLRMKRPGSIETMQQELVVKHYHDYLYSNLRQERH